MKTRSVVVASLALLVLSTAAAPAAFAEPRTPSTGTTRYLVSTTASPQLDNLAVRSIRRSGGSVEHVYTRAFRGFSADLTTDQAENLLRDSRIESVTPDARVHADGVQTNPTWGLDRIDQRGTGGNRTYRYDTTGSGVTAFVVDTGVRLTHSQFGGRARSGYDFIDGDSNASDCAGHGTHVAGTIGGSTYGVAKSVKIVSVRVLDCEGSGWLSDVIAGLDWVIAHKPVGASVVNMSLSGGRSPRLDDAVDRTVAAGIPVVVAAGNENEDASLSSPAAAPRAITVAATDSSDHRSWFSNYGRSVDIFAPGEDVRSASNAGNTATEVMSGTSMATPHVVGVVARYLQRYPRSTPAQTMAALARAATPRAVSDPDGSPNLLLYAAQKAVVPGMPTKVAASTSSTAKTATLTWSAPVTDGGSPVTGYRVTRDGTSSTGAGPVSVTVSATTRSYTFTKLRKGFAYTLSVRAVNGIGSGQAVSTKLAPLK